MLLRQIKLKNFRQYYGEVEIKFATDKVKNVTIIHAENGVGKTALLNAIKWCFYGEFTSNFRQPELLISFEAESEGKVSCSVEIEFENGGEEFLIIRAFDKNHQKQKNILSGALRIFKKIEGTWGGSLPEPELVINGMLPREMADYFFFQGEGSNAVEVGAKGINLGKSIRNILGFKIADNVVEILRKNSNLFTKRIAELDTTGEAQKLATEVERLSDKRQSIEVSISEIETRIPDLQASYNQVDSELSQIDNLDLKSLRAQELELKQTLSRLERDHKESLSSKYKVISRFGWAVFGREFADESLDFIDESTLKGRLPEPYNQTFINDILEASKCICGQALEPGSEHYMNIAKLLEKAANPSLQSRFGGIRAQIQSIKAVGSVAGDTITNILYKTDSLEEQIQKANNSLTQVSEKILLIPAEVIARLQLKKQSLSGDLSRQNQSLGGFKVQLENITTDLDGKIRRLKALHPNSSLMDSLTLNQNFIDELRSYLQNHLAFTEKSVRLHIVKKVNDMMTSFSRHSYHIKVSEKDFSIYLVNSDDVIVGQGDGLNLLLNLSITAALIEFVKDNQRVRDPLLTSATVAPLVIDAPFGVLDDSYRNVVVSSLPAHAEQVMFFVSSSQWRDEMNAVIKDRIGAEYCLILEEKSDRLGRPLDVFKVNGCEIIANKYGCERDRVIAVEV